MDQAIRIIQSAIATQMDWTKLKELVQEEQAKNNPVALIIHQLKLETNQICLKLSEPKYEEFSDDSDDEEELKPQLVDVLLSLSAYGNARAYHDFKKQALSKQEKTIQASESAIQSASSKIKAEMKELEKKRKLGGMTNVPVKVRKPFWFEKFGWFISGEGYLVILYNL